MKNRKFGVEIEFHSNYIGYYGIIDLLRKNRIRVGRNYSNSHSIWRLGHDGSDLELKSPVFTGTEGFNALEKVMNILTKEGCRVTIRDGLHVHHDGPEFVRSVDNQLKLVAGWMANQKIINLMVKSTRVNRGACLDWTKKDFETYAKDPDPAYADRLSLNLNSLAYHNTIEIRKHEGTLDYGQAEAWILFGQNFINNCLDRVYPIPPIDDLETFLRRIRVPAKARHNLLQKARKPRGRTV